MVELHGSQYYLFRSEWNGNENEPIYHNFQGFPEVNKCVSIATDPENEF